jgi:hypothetical protein
MAQCPEVVPMMPLPIYIYHVETPEGAKDYISCLGHEHVFAHGLPPESIIGVLTRPLESGEAITPAVFARNRVFVEFMHRVIARRGPQLPGLIAEARRQGDGLVVVIDQRTPTPQGPVPPEDIVGVFEVKNGQTTSERYHASPNHLILSSNGFFRLDTELQSCLLEELAKLTASDSPIDRPGESSL